MVGLHLFLPPIGIIKPMMHGIANIRIEFTIIIYMILNMLLEMEPDLE